MISLIHKAHDMTSPQMMDDSTKPIPIIWKWRRDLRSWSNLSRYIFSNISLDILIKLTSTNINQHKLISANVKLVCDMPMISPIESPMKPYETTMFHCFFHGFSWVSPFFSCQFFQVPRWSHPGPGCRSSLARRTWKPAGSKAFFSCWAVTLEGIGW